MKAEDKEQLKRNIKHIFLSGANEIRIFEMFERFYDRISQQEREKAQHELVDRYEEKIQSKVPELRKLVE